MKRPKADEDANTATHALGAVLGLVGSYFMVTRLIEVEASTEIWIACCLYLFSLVGLFASSAGSHLFREPPLQTTFRRLDQAFIFLLIVGSFTPFSIAHLNSTWWWCMLGLMWVVAIVGFVSKIFWSHRIQRVSVWLYLFLGWIPAFGGVPFTDEMPRECMLSILYGGIVYSLGTVFLFNDTKGKFFHAIWHLFVVAAAAIHFVGIMKHVVG